MWKRALVLALALSFAAGPALARGGRWKSPGRHGDHGAVRVKQVNYYGQPYRGHSRARWDARDAVLFLGLAAIGVTAISAWSQNAAARQRVIEPYPAHQPVRVYEDGRAWEDRRVVFDEQTVTPVGDVYRDGGEYCREYQTDVEIGGRLERAYGTACLQPDGSWATR